MCQTTSDGQKALSVTAPPLIVFSPINTEQYTVNTAMNLCNDVLWGIRRVQTIAQTHNLSLWYFWLTSTVVLFAM